MNTRREALLPEMENQHELNSKLISQGDHHSRCSRGSGSLRSEQRQSGSDAKANRAMNITEHQITPAHRDLLRRMLRREFDECEWYREEEVVELAAALGFDDLAKEMEEDAKHQIPLCKGGCPKGGGLIKIKH